MSFSREQPPKSKPPSQKDDSGTTPSAHQSKKDSKGSTSGEILLHRPRRPVKPEPQVIEHAPANVEPEVHPPESMAHQPIPPPSEPMQYRAIGLVRGVYKPSEEQFNRGTLQTEDGTELDAVLLGQVMSLVKKYLDLEQPYLWVVYPRTRDKQDTLHVQIVGVWSEQGFGNETDSDDAGEDSVDTEVSEDTTEGEQTSGVLSAPLQDGYFSVRGQVVFQSPEKQFVLVKIQQAPRKGADRPKDFKLKLIGTLEGSAIGYFWDLQVQRQGNTLEIASGKSIAMVPLKKRKKTGSSMPRKKIDVPRSGSRRPTITPKKDRQSPRTIERPIKRQDRSGENG